jgi:hypothetical protein
MCSDSLYTFYLKHCSFEERDSIINVHKCSCKVSVIPSQILMKVEFSWQIFGKSSNIKFHEDPCGSSVGTDGRDDPNSRFSQFYERA